MELPRRWFLRLAGAALPAASQIAAAQAYPARPVRFVVGFPANGPNDILARIIAQWLAERLGQPFTVENQPGASGNIATAAVVRVPPDGHTLLLVGPAIAISGSLSADLGFNFLRDIAPVAGITREPLVMVVHPGVPARTVAEFIAHAKADPPAIKLASTGNGSAPHVSGELFKIMTALDLTVMHYPGGGPALKALIEGQAAVMFEPLSAAIEPIRSGKLRALAVTTATRSPALPDVATVGDAVPGYEASAVTGVGVPKATPAEIIAVLNGAINAAFADPAMQARLAATGGSVLPGSPAAFGALMAEGNREMGQGDQGFQAKLIGAGLRTAQSLAVALWALALASGAAHAQAYPNRTIKLIVPFTPGSPVDAAARVLTQHLQARLGQSIIIENRSGGGTTIGTKAVATAAADGYTLLLIGPNIAYAPVLHPNLDFDPLKSLVPVATVVTWSHVLVVAPSVPARSMAELIAYAKSNPGQLVFGFGQGTTPHILGETLKQAAGIDLAAIPYRGGEQARTDLLGGRVHINIAPTASLLPLIQDGKARPLAYTGASRSADLPDVPTMIESGLPQVGFNPDVWLGVLAPAGTSAAVIEKLNAEINESLRSPALQAAFAKLGFETKATSPQEFAAFLALEAQKWPPLLRAAGLKAE